MAYSSSSGMLSRAYTAAGAPCGSAYPSERGYSKLRRAKSMSSTVTQNPLCPAVTRSDNLTEQERHNQARAAAAKAFRNDLLRRGDPGTAADGTPLRRPSVRFEPTPPSDPDYNPYAFLRDEQETFQEGDRKENSDNLLLCRNYDPTYISTAPSSYRRLRRSRSLFSITHTKSGYSRESAAPERSKSVNGTDLKPRRSMSFLRGGTDFMPSTYRRGTQSQVRGRKPLYSLGASSFRGDKIHVSTEAVLPQKPHSLRMKVRRMSSSIISSVRRAFFVGNAKETDEVKAPPQHVLSNRAYFGDYDNMNKKAENIPQDLFMSRVNSGAPTLRRVPSSIGYPSRSGSIRIVTPPKMTGTPLSSSANTWASSTTASTLRSGTGSKRLSIIREATPKNEGEGEIKDSPRPRSKTLDAQRVYSAFLRVTRAKNVGAAHGAENQALDGVEYMGLSEHSATQSCSSFASTVRNITGSPKKSTEGSIIETPCPSPKHIIGRENKENIPPTQFTGENKYLTRTHVKIGPRITLYPPPEPGIAPVKEEKEREQAESVPKTVRHSQSAFFPYTGGHATVGISPSPYKRATAMSPDVPSIYSRTTSGETPRPTSTLPDSPLAQASPIGDSTGHRSQFVQLGRKISLVQMNESRDGIFHNRMTPSPSKNSLPSYHTTKTSRDENVPFSTYLPGLMRLGEDASLTTEASPPVSTFAGSFGVGFFNRGRGRRDVGLGLVTKSGDGIIQRESKQKHRVLTAKNLQEGVGTAKPDVQPLSGIDSNVGPTLNIEDKRNSWGLGTGIRLPNRSQVPTGIINFGKKGVDRPKSPNSAYGVGNASNIENGRKPQDVTGNSGVGITPGIEILGQMSKFSFEVDDDRGYTLVDNLSRASVDSHLGGPRRLLRNDGVNASVESGIGAFL